MHSPAIIRRTRAGGHALHHGVAVGTTSGLLTIPALRSIPSRAGRGIFFCTQPSRRSPPSRRLKSESRALQVPAAPTFSILLARR